jgi:hypothetical protein
MTDVTLHVVTFISYLKSLTTEIGSFHAGQLGAHDIRNEMV